MQANKGCKWQDERTRIGIDFDRFLRVSSGDGRDGAASDSQHRRCYLRDRPCTGAVIAIAHSDASVSAINTISPPHLGC